MRELPLVIANLLLAFSLFSQSIDIPIESITTIKSFDGEKEFGISLSLSDDHIIIFHEGQNEKLFSLSGNLILEEFENSNFLNDAFLKFEDEIYGFQNKKFTKANSEDWNVFVSNTIHRDAVKSLNNSILLLKTSILGSEVERLSTSGLSMSKLDLRSSQICSYRSAIQHLTQSKDGSVYLIGYGIEHKNKGDKSLTLSKLSADLKIKWEQKTDIADLEKVSHYFFNSDGNLNIIIEGENPNCKAANYRMLTVHSEGSKLESKCLQILSENSYLQFNNGFITQDPNKTNSFAYYNELGGFEFRFTLPYDSVSDFELFNNKLIFTSESEVLALDLGETSDQFNSEKDLEYHIYPNPTQDNISIKWGDKERVFIYSAHGILVEEINLINGFIRFDISHLANGLYFVSDTNKNKVRSFVKAKLY